MQGTQEWRAVCQREEGAVGGDALLRAAQAGDRAAMERLLTGQERRLYALCRGMLGHAADAEDAVQETFLRALRSLPDFRGSADVHTWIFRIAINVCLDWKRARRPHELWSEAAITASDPSPETAVLRRLRLLEALGTLPPRQRMLLLLKELEGWSVAEIAAALRCNEKRVHNELYRARRALAEWRQRDAQEGDPR
jgi:RNA polymerase sigma-70 factor (ECF subfamily)